MAGPLARRYYLALRARCPTVRRAAARPRAHRSGDRRLSRGSCHRCRRCWSWLGRHPHRPPPPTRSPRTEMMREGYVTAYLPDEPQSGHRVARHESDLPMRARASAPRAPPGQTRPNNLAMLVTFLGRSTIVWGKDQERNRGGYYVSDAARLLIPWRVCRKVLA